MSHTESSATAVTPSPSAQAGDSAVAAEISSMRLLGDQGLLRIAHKGAIYTLRATSKGGLILTK